MDALFCPLEPAWGDWGTWLGAVATAFAAWAVWRIDKRDKRERENAATEAKKRAAVRFVADFVDAISLLVIMRRHREPTPDVPGDETNADYAQRLLLMLNELHAARCTQLRATDGLDYETSARVHLAERKLHNAQQDFKERRRYHGLVGDALLQALAKVADEAIDEVMAAGSAIWVTATEQPLPWAEDAKALAKDREDHAATSREEQESKIPV
jgi:hypothetical protein